MVDEKKLDEIEEMVCMHPKGTHAFFSETQSHGAWLLDADILNELIRLARLGLWAEKHGVPTLREALAMSNEDDYSPGAYIVKADEALKALPKDKA